jgi:acyl carrier protein
MRRGARFADTENLVALGILDSISIAELVAEVQERYGIEVPDIDITEANFGSIAAIASYVCRRRAD